MKVLNFWVERQIALCLATLLVAPIGAAQTIASQTAGEVPKNSVAAKTVVESAAKGQEETIAAASVPDGSGVLATQTPDQNQSPPPTPQTKPEKPTPAPVGTAAAPYEKPEGVPASRPSGAAIAPAKQRRTRSFAIRIALLAGAGVAIGVVAAATLGSPSRPQ
jgi:hypothetical protein